MHLNNKEIPAPVLDPSMANTRRMMSLEGIISSVSIKRKPLYVLLTPPEHNPQFHLANGCYNSRFYSKY